MRRTRPHHSVDSGGAFPRCGEGTRRASGSPQFRIRETGGALGPPRPLVARSLSAQRAGPRRYVFLASERNAGREEILASLSVPEGPCPYSSIAGSTSSFHGALTSRFGAGTVPVRKSATTVRGARSIPGLIGDALLRNRHPSSSRSLRALSLSSTANGLIGGTARVVWNCSRAASVLPIRM